MLKKIALNQYIYCLPWPQLPCCCWWEEAGMMPAFLFWLNQLESMSSSSWFRPGEPGPCHCRWFVHGLYQKQLGLVLQSVNSPRQLTNAGVEHRKRENKENSCPNRGREAGRKLWSPLIRPVGCQNWSFIHQSVCGIVRRIFPYTVRIHRPWSEVVQV